jgi:hypothetical protein
MLPWLILLLILILGAAAGLYYWQTRINVHHLEYTLLPSYEIPDVILVGGVVVENRGRQPAPNVKINIQFDGTAATMIHHIKVTSAANAVLRSGGERHTFATVSTRLLAPRSKIFINWAAAHDVQPQITVTTYQPTPDTFLSKLLPRNHAA